MNKSHSYFAHDADVGVVGRGATPEAAMEAAAEATFSVMADLEAIRPQRAVQFSFKEDDLDLVLVTWLNRLLAEARIAGLALGRFSLCRRGGEWVGEGWGEPWREALGKGAEVKGATLTMLAVEPVGAGWEVRCVVDV
jgi:SHS2 domain-containing protein